MEQYSSPAYASCYTSRHCLASVSNTKPSCDLTGAEKRFLARAGRFISACGLIGLIPKSQKISTLWFDEVASLEAYALLC